MMKRFVVALYALLLPTLHVAHAAEPMDLYDTERQALSACGKDPVVWLIVPKSTYWRKGETGYGTGPNGGYTCQRDADHASNHHVGAPTKRATRRH